MPKSSNIMMKQSSYSAPIQPTSHRLAYPPTSNTRTHFKRAQNQTEGVYDVTDRQNEARMTSQRRNNVAMKADAFVSEEEGGDASPACCRHNRSCERIPAARTASCSDWWRWTAGNGPGSRGGTPAAEWRSGCPRRAARLSSETSEIRSGLKGALLDLLRAGREKRFIGEFGRGIRRNKAGVLNLFKHVTKLVHKQRVRGPPTAQLLHCDNCCMWIQQE